VLTLILICILREGRRGRERKDAGRGDEVVESGKEEKFRKFKTCEISQHESKVWQSCFSMRQLTISRCRFSCDGKTEQTTFHRID